MVVFLSPVNDKREIKKTLSSSKPKTYLLPDLPVEDAARITHYPSGGSVLSPISHTV